MHATTGQLKSVGTYISSFIRTHITVNGSADIMVKAARLTEVMSGGVSRVSRSLEEKASNAITGQAT